MSRLEATAFHEAGHAVMALRLARPFWYVTVEREDDAEGHVQFCAWPRGVRPDIQMTPGARDLLERAALTALAGPAAERVHTGRWNRVGARSDFGGAADFVLRICGESQASQAAYLKWLHVVVDEILRVRWDHVIAVAEALLERRRLTQREVRAVIDAADHVPPFRGGAR